MTTMSDKQHKKREFILRELVDTEAKFVRHMKEVVDCYMTPLEDALRDPKKNHILKQEYIQTSFSVIRQILNLSIPFLEDLRKIDPTDQNFAVGKVMKPIVPYYKLYKVYAGNHSNAMSTIERCSTSKPKFQKFLQEVKKRSDISGETLNSLLIMPIQRLLRLKMLLERLLKFTPETHCDFKNLTSCLQAVRDVADHVNHGVTEKENRIKVWEVQQRMVPPPPDLVKPHRTFVREGKLLKVCRRTDKARHFFLFNDILVYGPSLTGNLINYSNSIALRRVLDLKRQKGGCAFAVFGIPKSFVLIASSRAEKKAWMSDLDRLCDKIEAGAARRRKTIKESDKKNESKDEDEEDFVTIQDDFEINGAPLWVPDNFSNACMCCGAVKFSTFSLRNRRHHCRMCGVLVCGNCSKNKLMLPHVDKKKPVRVCDKCKNRMEKKNDDDNEKDNDDDNENVVEDDFVMIENMNTLPPADDNDESSEDDDIIRQMLSSDEEAEIDSQRHRPSQVSGVQRLCRELHQKADIDRPSNTVEPEMKVMEALKERKRSIRLSQHYPDTATLLSAPTIAAPMSSTPDRIVTYRPADAAVLSVCSFCPPHSTNRTHHNSPNPTKQVPVVIPQNESRRDSLRHNRPGSVHQVLKPGSKVTPSSPIRGNHNRVVSGIPDILQSDDVEIHHDDERVLPGNAHNTNSLISSLKKITPSSPSRNHVVSLVPRALSSDDVLSPPENSNVFLPAKAHTTTHRTAREKTSVVRPSRSISEGPEKLLHESSSRHSMRILAGSPATQLGLSEDKKFGVSEAAKPSLMVRKASKMSRKRRLNENRERKRVERQMAKWTRATSTSSNAHLAKTVAHTQETHRAKPPGGGRRRRRGRRALISKMRTQV